MRYCSRMAKCNIIVGILFRTPNSSVSVCNGELDKMLSSIQEDKKHHYDNTLGKFTGLSLDSHSFTNLFFAHYYEKPTLVIKHSSTCEYVYKLSYNRFKCLIIYV